MRKTFAIACALACVSCSQREITVKYDKTGGGEVLLGEVQSACELAGQSEFAGRYYVESITGVYEEVSPDEWRPHTYIELKLKESWGGPAQDETVRIAGGPLPGGGTMSQFVEIEKGTEIAVLLGEAPDWNAGYRLVEIEQLFKPTSEHSWSNGFITGTDSELSSVFRQVIEDGSCPRDIEPNR